MKSLLELDRWRKANMKQAEKVRVEKRIQELEGSVRSIERETWDRPDAVEDNGNGT